LNNVVKHARATQVWLRLRLEAAGLTLIVEDDGQGLPAAGRTTSGGRLSSGHGLPNLEKRLAAVGGRCTVRSAPGQGTRVELSVRLEPVASPIVATGQEAASGAK
jgi:signal transduction histidine kinase